MQRERKESGEGDEEPLRPESLRNIWGSRSIEDFEKLRLDSDQVALVRWWTELWRRDLLVLAEGHRQR